ncbi:hypothetical protein GCM10011351_18180 [Paraliobacillus quinghaiensis]|uniref:Uncharacterized protein n=1 Tax=Paraliobacillus quinghaiensis TaxID=470815 RepID=A0A917TQB7_9BACI|nr:AimR family lysis-lysogeny pheromone receptor [Paraliobacillus quinghaiensis]GGM32464.1 hypothetical protein GCM10011351_18180 [Paraliobacillus quinghaiensis]
MEKVNPFHIVNSKNYHKLNMDLEQYILWASQQYGEAAAISLARDFCLVSTNEHDLRIGMFFLYINGFYEDVAILIERNKQTRNQLNDKWAKSFELIVARRQRSIPHHQILDTLKKINTDDDIELKCILHITLINIHFDLYQYEEFGELIEELQSFMSRIENQLALALCTRSYELLLCVYYWKRNALILSRKYGFRLLNQMYNEKQKAHLHVNLSLTYIFDDYESSIYHLQQARKIAVDYEEERLLKMIDNQNYPFVYAHFGKPENVTTTIVSEQAHLEIAKGNFEKAQSLLQGFTNLTPFTKYYLGLAYQDRKQLVSSYNDFFKKRSDHFFARLPLQAIQKM